LCAPAASPLQKLDVQYSPGCAESYHQTNLPSLAKCLLLLLGRRCCFLLLPHPLALPFRQVLHRHCQQLRSVKHLSPRLRLLLLLALVTTCCSLLLLMMVLLLVLLQRRQLSPILIVAAVMLLHCSLLTLHTAQDARKQHVSA
jgi:hypothetical protein